MGAWRVWGWVIGAVAALLLVAPVMGQPRPRRPPPVEFVRVEFGYDGTMAAERWSPIRVWVTSQEKAFSGALIVEYSQDPTQESRIVVPFATTPGVTTPIETAAVLPQRCERLRLILTDVRRRYEREYAQGTSFSGLSLPRITLAEPRVLLIGDTTSADAFESATMLVDPVSDGAEHVGDEAPLPPPPPIAWTGQPLQQKGTPEERLWSRITAVQLKPELLPRGWMVYESADVILASADGLAKAGARSRAAIMTWVEAGGRLIIQVDDAGNVWRQFLPQGPEGDVVEIRSQGRVRAGEELAVIATGARPDSKRKPPEESQRPLRFKGRLMALTPDGARQGWRLGWYAASAPDGEAESEAQFAAANSGQTGLIATGPVGMGMVTLVGTDPRRVPHVLSTAGTRGLWREVIEGVMPEHVVTAASQENYGWFWGWGSAPDQQAWTALSNVLARVSTVPPIGAGVIIVIAVFMAGLALMIGPGDWLLLKRLGRMQRSWMTALAWIALASAAAYIAPALMRSGKATLTRFTTVDTLCDRHGVPVKTWRTTVSGLFGGRPQTYALEGADAGTWSRGVSALGWYSSGGRTFSALESIISTAREEPPVQGAVPETVAIGQWTFRTWLEQSPGRRYGDEVGARVRRDGDRWRIALVNLPREAKVNSAEVVIGEDRYTVLLDGPRESEDVWNGLLVKRLGQPEWHGGDVTADFTANSYSFQNVEDPRNFALPMFRDRTAAADARVGHGGYALVSLMVEGLPCDVQLTPTGDMAAVRLAAVRILVPLAAGETDEE